MCELHLSALLSQAKTDVFDDKQRSERDFFEYVAKSYKYFLAGDDYQSQAVDDEIAQEAEARAEEVRQRNQQLQQVSSTTCLFLHLLVVAFLWPVLRPEPLCTQHSTQ